MGNEWTDLTKEAGELGSPDKLRKYYTNIGIIKGLATSGAIIALGTITRLIKNKNKKR